MGFTDVCQMDYEAQLIIHRFPAMAESGKPYKKSEENAKKQNL